MSSTATGVMRGELPPPALQRAQAGYVIGELEGTRFGLDLSSADASGNDAVFSTIDPRVQALAQQQLQRFLEGLAAAVGLTQGALITLNTQSGDILAYVGGCSHGACSPGGSASVIDGLALSENVVALRLAERAGLGEVVKLARRLGISTPMEAAQCRCMASAASTTSGSASRSRVWIAARSRASPCRSETSHAS